MAPKLADLPTIDRDRLCRMIENLDAVAGCDSKDDEFDSKGLLRRRRVDGVDCVALFVMRGIPFHDIVAFFSLPLSTTIWHSYEFAYTK